ncbi:Collagen alpha-5VI chain [Gigaspora margarita]|uniref:Collagen alpha-5VI chain n=1 Tax=Gigaspora margarita TaxID=4874 RepID=A0A8H4ETY7_GIGMA|nr:Collagen alpha-5VI chain [Gigaspora margarita]
MDHTSLKFEENIKAIGTISNSLCNSDVNNANIYCTMIMPFSELVIRNIKELFENYKNFKYNEFTEKVKQNAQACMYTLEIHEYLYADFNKVLMEWNGQSEHFTERKEVFKHKHDKKAALAVGVTFVPYLNLVAAPTIGYFAYKNKKASKEAGNQAEHAVTAAEQLKEHLIEPIENFIDAMKEISRSLDTLYSLNHNSEEINIIESCSFTEEKFYHCRNQPNVDVNNGHVQSLLANIQNINKNNWTFLHFAAATGCIEVVKILLKQKHTYEVNRIDKNGKTALDLATENKHIEIVKHLLEANNEEKLSNEEEFCHINFAIEKGYINVCKLLLEEKMKKEDCFFSSILHYCAWKGDNKILKFLLNNEESSNHDENGKTLLHWAASKGHETTVKYLIKLNANLVNEVDKNKETALYDAVWNGHMKIIEILLKERAEINIENKNNWNPLDIALISCQPEAFIFLRDCIENNSKNADLFNQINGSQLDNYYRFKYNSTMELVEKLQNVESHLNKPGNNDIDSLSFYQFFLKHIEKYEENLNDEERKNPEQYKKVLSYLRICTFSKICYLKRELGSNLIIDINAYFETIEDDIKKLNDTKKQNAIIYFNDQYNNAIKTNVQEAYSTIHDIIKPEMENIGDKINEKMKSLINEAKQLIEGAEENKKDLEKKQKDLKNKLILKKLLGILKITSHAMGYVTGTPIGMLAEMTFELYDKYQKEKEKLDLLNNAIKQAEDDINKLKSYEESIYSQIIPMIEKMQSDMNNLGNQIDKKSHVFLDISKWQVRSSLNEVKLILRQISKGFPEIRDYLTSYMDKLNEGMTTIINIYDRIQSCYDQSRLANYIANISSPTNTIEIENEKLKKEIEKLEREIRFNIILGYYKKAISAFRQWVFPFAHLYSNAILLPLNNSDEAIANIIQQIADLKLDIKKDNATINKKDQILMKGDFRPFFVWENKKYHQEISELLNGEEITIKADIEEIDRKKSAIKFDNIKIRFKSIDKTMQNEIDSMIQSSDAIVSMTHLGNSYYRFGNEFHVIRSQPVTIRYSFKTNNEGPVRTNNTYTKINKGSIMLSPYTMWKLKLSPNEKDDFNKLRTYKDKVNLELVGHGTYVDSDNIVNQGEILTG